MDGSNNTAGKKHLPSMQLTWVQSQVTYMIFQTLPGVRPDHQIFLLNNKKTKLLDLAFVREVG